MHDKDPHEMTPPIDEFKVQRQSKSSLKQRDQRRRPTS